MTADRTNAKGRKPMGPRLVRQLEGSELAKQRLEVILETIAGGLPIREACERLGIGEARFHQLRTAVLEAGLSRLEPRPAGRPAQAESAEEARIAELSAQLEDARRDRHAAEVRAEIARAMPDAGEKKTTDRRQKKKRPSAKRSATRRKRKPRRRSTIWTKRRAPVERSSRPGARRRAAPANGTRDVARSNSPTDGEAPRPWRRDD